MTNKYSPRRVYSEEDKNMFIEVAREQGVSKAIKELQYPSWPTALRWVKDIDGIPKSITAALASLNNVTYTQEERLSLLNNLMDDASNRMLTETLDVKEYKMMVESIKILNETYNLVLGKAQQISQKNDAMDESLIDLYADIERQNKLKESQQ